MLVREVMSLPVTVAPGATVPDVARTFLERGVRGVAVVDGSGKLTGLITETDLLVRNANLHFPSYLGILENLLPIGGDRNLEAELRRVLGVTAAEVMTGDVHTARPDEDLGEVAHYMVQHQLHAVPVVNEHGALEGMLYPADVIRLIARDAGA
ncbi:MAG TPA: CBS domain-containing protein [Chloroflexota bacterium]|jgi:CBS domain-containing protein|nr:CBS domain-containing protein [Chloroflexota bacterium]